MTPGSGAKMNYSFDPSGSLTTLPGGGTGNYDKAGELTSQTQNGTTTSYTYDAAGRQLGSQQGSTALTSATWNGAGQLTAYTSPSATMTSATYNGDGLRMTATTGSAAQTFTWNTLSPIPQVLMDSQNVYIYSGGQAPAEQVNLATGAITYLTADSLGSVRGTVTASGVLTATTRYDAWGNPAAPGGLTTATPFGYAGGYTDPTGLIYLLNRYYDPATGQFTSLDPMISQTIQPYGYAGGNPVSNSDPNGACGFWNDRCWYYWALVGVLEAGAVGFAIAASGFCDEITFGICSFVNYIFVRGAFIAAYAIAGAWLNQWCRSFWCYFWTGVSSFLGSVFYTGGLAWVLSPMRQTRFRLWVYFNFQLLMRYFRS